MSIRIEIDRRLREGLASEVERAIARMDTRAAMARIEFVIKRRTSAGRYLAPSSPGHERYSPGHRRRRERRGLQTSKVDLFMTGRMLDAVRTRSSIKGAAARLEVGYLGGLSEAQASRLAAYHDRLGAGTSHVVRHFVGLSDDEQRPIIEMLERAFLRGLS